MGGDHLYYAWHDGSSWQIDVVDTETGVGLYTSLALDSADRPHIAYFSFTMADLRYAWRRPLPFLFGLPLLPKNLGLHWDNPLQ